VPYRQIAAEIPAAIRRTMIADGPFGPQISGGTNLDEDPGDFYLPEDAFYYDGEDTASMLAPIYGMTGFDDEAWVNYHRFARSLWCPNFDPEFETLYWFPTDPAVFDGTAYFSRLGGCLTRAEMAEGLQNIFDRYVDLSTGSLFWWPFSDDFRRSLTRCSQGQGAWAWQYLYQWLGLTVDAPSRTLTFAPRGLLTSIKWRNFAAGPHRFSLEWNEGADFSTLSLENHNDAAWTVQIGTRAAGTGAESSPAYQRHILAPGAALALEIPIESGAVQPGQTRDAVIEKETAAFGSENGLLFKRFGTAMLWGHWESAKLWDLTQLPLTLRFLVQAAGGEELKQGRVTLVARDGWQVAARRPYHWDRPDEKVQEQASIELGSLEGPGRATASFWVCPPAGTIFNVHFGNRSQPLHMPSQPGPGVELHAPNLAQAMETHFTAYLEAVTKDGTTIQRELDIPLVVHNQ
jgi:hypothetical protein